MAKKIISQSDCTKGELIDEPPRATIALYTPDGAPMYRCPHCGNVEHAGGCDCLGAEPGCLFCNQCNGEFEIPYRNQLD